MDQVRSWNLGAQRRQKHPQWTHHRQRGQAPDQRITDRLSRDRPYDSHLRQKRDTRHLTRLMADGVSVSENGAAPDTITATIPKAADLRKFARLRVTETP